MILLYKNAIGYCEPGSVKEYLAAHGINREFAHKTTYYVLCVGEELDDSYAISFLSYEDCRNFLDIVDERGLEYAVIKRIDRTPEENKLILKIETFESQVFRQSKYWERWEPPLEELEQISE